MLIAKATRRLAATTIAVFVLALSTVCGSAPAKHTSAMPLYRVTAFVTSDHQLGLRACYFIAFTEPPQCGVGIRVSRVDIGSLAGVRRYSNGTIVSGPVELIGSWDRGVLTVTTTTPAKGSPTVAHFVSMTPEGTGDPVDAQRRLNADANQLANRGIIVLENGFNSNKNLYVVVAVADASTVAYLSQQYGPVVIGEWLAPT